MERAGDIFGAGERLGDPIGDPARVAVASLRGYGYQLYASALAWLRLSDGETLHLEVAEDYATAAKDVLTGVQVKDTAGSGSLTVKSPGVAASIDAFVHLVDRNPGRKVTLRHLTTSPIGREKAVEDRIEGGSSLAYWRRAAGGAPVAPLRALLLRLRLAGKTREFIEARGDEELREDLVRLIHWDAGQAPLAELAEELTDGLIEFASSVLRLNADIGRRMVDRVLTTVLRTSIKTEGRRLTRANLILLGEEVGRISVPVGILEAVLATAPAGRPAAREPLLMPGHPETTTIPSTERPQLVGEVGRRLSAVGFAVVTGSTGMGKTFVASRAAGLGGRPWHMAGFRDVDRSAAAGRLGTVLGEAASSPTAIILLDDLEGIDDPSILRALRRLVAAMRRRDGAVVVTCAASPTRRSLESICGSPEATVEVPYLTMEEVGDLIEGAGGGRGLGRIVHAAGSAGHPQLVQAAILHLRGAGWSRGAVHALFIRDAADIADERRAARDRLVAAMPGNARAILFRMSLVRGRFPRALALALADVDPTIAQPGVEIDRLIGPWIERPDSEQLRVSPLVANAGCETLSPAEVICVHRVVADFLLRSDALSVDQGDAVLHHAMEGGDPSQLIGYAHSVLSASSETLEALARHAPAIAYLTTDGPIHRSNPTISLMLRLAQLLITLAGGHTERAMASWAAMRSELLAGQEGTRFEIVVLSKILVQTTVVAAIPDWVELLVRFDALLRADGRTRMVAEATREAGNPIDDEVQGFAFIRQGCALRSTRELRAAFERLGAMPHDVRARLLSGLDAKPGNYGLLVDAPWLHSAKKDDFDGERAAADYGAMAALAGNWGDAKLSARCHAARATMLDEYARDPVRALAALDDAQAQLGAMASISRARAKIHWRSRDHLTALLSLEVVWQDAESSHDPVERGFIAREAGISAAETDDWAAARQWFQRAYDCFSGMDVGALPSLRIGVGADAAQAAYKAGDAAGAIDGYARALDDLKGLDPESSLQAAYCHRVILNAVLWLMRKAAQEARGTTIDFEETYQPAGACSNPDPPEAIRDRPLGPLDIGWYLLADAALDLGQVDFFHDLHMRLGAGAILGLEIGRQKRLADHLLSTRNVPMLMSTLPQYASGTSHLKSAGTVQSVGDLMNPVRAALPPCRLDGNESSVARQGAIDLLICFAMAKAMDGDRETVQLVRTAIVGAGWPNLGRVARLMAGAEGQTALPADQAAVSIAETLGAGGHPTDLATAFEATVRFLLWVSTSEFRVQMAPRLEGWAVETWSRIIARHPAEHALPKSAAARIAAAIDGTAPSLARVARIALAAAAGVLPVLSIDVRTMLTELAQS